MDKFAAFSQLFDVDKLPTAQKREFRELASFLEIYLKNISQQCVYDSKMAVFRNDTLAFIYDIHINKVMSSFHM